MNVDSQMIVTDKQACAEVRTDVNTSVRSLFAKQNYKINDVISNFSWNEVFETPTYLTVQIEEDKHIELIPKYLECINHSCEPNAFFDTKKKQLICIKPINVGEEFTFFYPSAEWKMDQPFECLCGSKDCIGFVRGAMHLSTSNKAAYRFTNFIQQKLKNSI